MARMHRPLEVVLIGKSTVNNPFLGLGELQSTAEQIRRLSSSIRMGGRRGRYRRGAAPIGGSVLGGSQTASNKAMQMQFCPPPPRAMLPLFTRCSGEQSALEERGHAKNSLPLSSKASDEGVGRATRAELVDKAVRQRSIP
jgi:hypothetical protein